MARVCVGVASRLMKEFNVLNLVSFARVFDALASFPAVNVRAVPRARGVMVGAMLLGALTPLRAETIKMGFTGSPTSLSLPFFVAKKKGWLGDLDVEEIYVTGDSNAMRILISGNVDIATIGAVNVLTAVEAGAKVKAIGSWQPIADYSLVIANGKGATIADLAGKTIATSGPGGMPDQLPRMMMRRYHIDENASRFIQIGGHAARLQAVVGGRADATLINFVTTAMGAGSVTVAASLAKEFPKLAYVWNVVREDSLADPRLAKIYQQLTDATIRGSRFIMENPDEAAQILHDRVPDLTLDVCKQTILLMNKDNLWGVNGGLDPEIAKFTAVTNKELGITKVEVPSDAFIDTRFIDAGLKTLGPMKMDH
jgi:NitT/TauT family transport system substrate-binding protein